MSPVLSRSLLAVALAGAMSLASAQSLRSNSTVSNGIPAGGPFVPAGTLYDNGQSNGTTSLASQNSTGTATARSGDDFILDGAACASGQFDISLIRVQMVQADAAPQPFAVDLFADNGSGTSPSPTNSISPLTTVAQTTQTNLGVFGVGTSVFEATFVPTGLVLDAGTRYWISGYGATAASNAGGFNNFFAASAGAAGTTANGMVIAPASGVANWTAAETVIGGSPLAFSFAIDGTCVVAGTPAGPRHPVPFSPSAWMLLLAGIGLIGGLAVARRAA